MKARTKILLCVMFVLVFILSFAIISSAQEFNVTTTEEFNTAYENAVDGDTIVIKNSISANFYFSKSITFILDGDVTWSISNCDGNMCDATGKTVNVYARGGNAVFYPTSKYFFNSYRQTQPDLSETTLGFGALDDESTMKIDWSLCYGRFFYFNSGAHLKEFNLYSGARVTGLNNTDAGGRYLYASTVNVYEGAEIYGNRLANYTGLFYADTLNIYGGKIYGNYFGCYGLSQSKVANVYGGEIVDNFIDGTGNNGVPSSLFNSDAGSTQGLCYIYAGIIDGNLLKTNASEKQSILRPGNNAKISEECYRNGNKYTSDWGEGPVVTDGAYKLDGFDMNSASYCAISGSYSLCDYGLVFKNLDSSLINAYLIDKSGNVSKSFDGSSAIVIPDGYAWIKSTSETCKDAIIPVTTAQGSYYATAHAISEDVVIGYPQGFAKPGSKGNPCTVTGCKHIANGTEVEPIITFNGFTTNVDNTGISGGYLINTIALKNYEDSSKKDFSFGLLALNPKYIGDTFLTDENKVNASQGFLQIDSISDEYAVVNIMIHNFSALTADFELVIAGYVVIDGKAEFIQEEIDLSSTMAKSNVVKNDASLYTITLNSILTNNDYSEMGVLPEYKKEENN